MNEQDAILTVVEELEQILASQLQGHEQLLDLVGRNREGVRRADMAEIKVACELQNAVSQTVSELEKRRLSLVGSLTRQFAPDAGRPLTVSEIVCATTSARGSKRGPTWSPAD